MSPLRKIVEPATKRLAQSVSRRSFVRDTGFFLFGLAAEQVVESAAGKVADAVMPEPSPRIRVATTLTRSSFTRSATPEQKALLQAYHDRASIRRLPWGTRAEIDQDAIWRIEWQGEGVRAHIWPDVDVAGMPMHRQPDPDFGLWAADRMTKCWLQGEPLFQSCHARIATTGKVERYTALMVPIGDRGVISLTSLT